MAKILCFVNHYFGENANSKSKSAGLFPENRKAIIEQCVNELGKIPDIDVRICGINGFNLIKTDINFPHLQSTPQLLVYESILKMEEHIDEYDYFINIEDDILMSPEVISNSIAFEKEHEIDEVLFPNRLEYDNNGNLFCIDLYALKTWTKHTMQWQNKTLRVASNPHSGLMILSRRQLKFSFDQMDKSFRGILFGRHMASAYAHVHQPFKLYRSYLSLEFHYVIHQDKWFKSPTLKPNESIDFPNAFIVKKQGRLKKILRKVKQILKLRKR